jgi:beta-lactamase class A
MRAQDIATQLDEMCDAQPFDTGWYFKDLLTGEDAHRNGNVVIPSASTRKIAVMMAAMKAIHDGKLALDQAVTIQEKYQNNMSGCFQHLLPGFTITLRDAMVMMIIVSDNTCTGTVADLVGLDEINAFSQSIGMKGTTHRHGIPPNNMPRDHKLEEANTTTPADVGLLLDLIQQGTNDQSAADRLGTSTELCQLGLDILSWQKLRARMPSLLPDGTKVAHKTGTARRGFNDAGIVFRDENPRFILTVYTDHVPVETEDGTPGSAAAGQHIARLTRRCWDLLE